MNKGTTSRSRALAWILTLAMVLSMVPVTAFAEEIQTPISCTHVHDASCGYVEAAAEVPCDKECTDADGDGVTDHAEDCAYIPAVEGQPCNHVHDENCGGLTEGQPEEPPIAPACTCGVKCAEGAVNGECDACVSDLTACVGAEPEPEEAAALSEELKALQARIHALPTGEEYLAMTADEQDAVYAEAADIADACLALTDAELAAIGHDKLEALFTVMNEGIQLYGATDPVTFLNSGYPYGKNMNSSAITLVIEVDGTAADYQWQVSDSKDGDFADISGADASTYTFTPTTGKWYRCMVNETPSKAVMAVYPGLDGRTWTYPNSSWYISNGTMAYMVNGTQFDVTGLYTKNGTNYMLQTSYDKSWAMYSSTQANPSPASSSSARASLDALRVSFSEADNYAIIFEADLADGHQAFSFGCDTQLGNSSTSGSYSDKAALNAMVKNGVLQQIAMIGAGTVAGAADTDPAFVIAPIDPVSKFWIGRYSSRQVYAYNTSGGTATETIDGQNVVTLLEGIDSGMTMSWMNVSSGGSVRFQFSVGDVAHTGAVSGKVDYETEMLTGLDAGTTYVITASGSQYTITANARGEIPLAGTDNAGNPYDFAGKTLTIAKQGSGDTPAEVDVADRPDAPDKPSDLEEEGSGTTTPTVDANIEIVALTPSSATISPKAGQQYAYSTDGVNWTTLTNTDSSGNYVIDGLQEGATISIRTRVAATSSAPASQWSEATRITLKSTVAVSATGWSGTYDGTAHQITVTSPSENASITYSNTADGNYSEDNPSYSSAGAYTVYYRVTAENYYPASGSATVTINQKELTVESIKVDNNNAAKEVTFSGLVGNDNLIKDTDYSVSNLRINTGATPSTASFTVTLQNTELAQNYWLSNGNVSGIPVIKHTHTWKYVTDDTNKNTIHAYCTQAEGSSDCAFFGAEQAVTLTLNASAATYSGNVYSGVSVTDNISSVTGATASDIRYYGKNGTSWTALEQAPTNAGVYKATITIGAATAEAEFEIAKATVATPTISSKTYSGSKQTADIPESTLYTVTANAGGTDVGGYRIALTLTDANNYQWDGKNGETTFQITKAALTVTAKDNTITYGDAPAGNGVTYSGFVNNETEGVLGGTLGYTSSYNQFDNVGTYTITPKGLTSDNYSIRFANGTLTVAQKEIGIQWGNLEFTYDGSGKTPVATATKTVNDDEITLTVTGSKTDAGTNYEAVVTEITGGKAGNYKLPTSGLTTTFTIQNASQTAPGSDKLTVTDESVKDKGDGKITIPSDSSTMEYRKDGEATYTTINAAEAANLPAGTYYVRYAAKPNYDASPDTEVTVGAGRMLTITLPSVQIGYTLTSNAAQCAWHGGASLTFTLAEEYSIQADFAVEATNAQVTDNGDGTFTVSNATEDVVVTVKGVADKVAPTAVIAIKEDKWTQFWNNLTFKLFFNDTVKVTITAADQGSGVQGISYYLSAAELTEEGVAASTIDWIAYPEGGFSINAVDAQTHIVYAKVTDHAGNILYLNADGMTMDKTAPVTDLEDGKSYYDNDKTFTPSDTNLESVTLDGKTLTPGSDGKYHISADNMPHKVVVTDKAGNRTEYNVTVYEIHTVTYVNAKDEPVATAEVNHGAALETLPDTKLAELPGFQPPKGWYMDGDAAKEATAQTVINADCTIKALYESKQYTGDDTETTQNVGGAKLDESDETLVKAALTEEEKQRVENGENVRVWLEADELPTNSVPSGDKTAIENKRGAYTVGMYLDASMFKQIGNDDPQKLTTLSKTVTITFSIPDRLVNVPDGYYRTYKVIRVHDGAAEQIDAKVNKSAKTLTFETDRFSTYAVTYKDTKSIIPQTGDNSGIWMATFTVALAALVVLFVIHKKQAYKPKYMK